MEEGNKVEKEVQQFWVLSRAWKRDPRYLGGVTFHSLIAGLEPLIRNGTPLLRVQANELADMAVRGKIRRKKGLVKGKVIQLQLKTKNNSQSYKAA